MITRPLELAARLRPAPRTFDAWFYVNAGVLALFFTMFGSRFVLAPGLGVDFQLPRISGATRGAGEATHFVTVMPSGQIYAPEGRLSMVQFRAWLRQEGRAAPHPGLLVRASAGVTTARMAEIASAANEAGFRVIWAADDPAPNGAN